VWPDARLKGIDADEIGDLEDEEFLRNELTNDEMRLISDDGNEVPEHEQLTKSDLDKLWRERKSRSICCLRCNMINDGKFKSANMINTNVKTMPRNHF